MSCNPAIISGYVDDALPPGARARVEAHLAGCAACRSQRELETSLRRRLQGLPPLPFDAALETRVRGALRKRATPARWASWGRKSLPLAAALVLCLLWGSGRAPVLAWQLAEDHANCHSLRSLDVAADVAAEAPLASGGADLRSMPRAVRGLTLAAASLCALRDGTVVLHLQYVRDEKRVSLFVVNGTVRFGGSYSGWIAGSDVRLVPAGRRTIGLVGQDQEDLDAFARAVSV